MGYERISGLPADFRNLDAISVDSLIEAWVEQQVTLSDSGVVQRFKERLERRWAIETGVIERLYDLDRGTTELLIEHGLDANLVQHGSSTLPPAELIDILEDHRRASVYVMDYLAGPDPLTTSFIKEIHALLTRHQPMVEGATSDGALIQIPLRRGDWKVAPNNPRRGDGTTHEYCPPLLVAEEMDHLLELFQSDQVQSAPSVARAAWLHHRFTQIHPFQDGNGRVARALVTFVLVKAKGFPVVVDRSRRPDYLDALETADKGDLQPLVRLFSELERGELEQALSLSESALADAPRIIGTNLRQKLLESLKSRAREKRDAIVAERERVLPVGKRLFGEQVAPAISDFAEQIKSVLQEELDVIQVRFDESNQENRHYFKHQVVQLARKFEYFSNIEVFHSWIRLRLFHGRDQEGINSEVVFSLHGLGREFTGVLAMTAYFASRTLDDTNQSITEAPHPLTTRPFTFSYREDATNLEERIEAWVTDALNVAIEEIRRAL